MSALSPGPDSSIFSFCLVYDALEADKLQNAMFFLQLPDHKLSCSQAVTFLVKMSRSGPAHGFNRTGYTVRRSAQQAKKKLDAEKVHQKQLIETLQQLCSFMLDII